MSNVLKEVLAANKKYAAKFGDKGKLPMPPGRHFAILTCMDARLDPAQYAGLAESSVSKSAWSSAVATYSGAWRRRRPGWTGRQPTIWECLPR